MTAAVDLHCAVVGAGIGGLAAALSLHEVGAHVEEPYPA
jgi:2-polyprenyl-6-methoxyphenol hydroxylase-like FAD-dependent oxidoreductase